MFGDPESDDGISLLTWLDDGHVVVTTSKRTVVVKLDDGSERASIRGGTATVVGCGGRLLANNTRDGVRLLRLRGDKLKTLASYPGLYLADGWGAQLPYQRLIDDLPVLGIGQLAWIPMDVEAALEA